MSGRQQTICQHILQKCFLVLEFPLKTSKSFEETQYFFKKNIIYPFANVLKSGSQPCLHCWMQKKPNRMS